MPPRMGLGVVAGPFDDVAAAGADQDALAELDIGVVGLQALALAADGLGALDAVQARDELEAADYYSLAHVSCVGEAGRTPRGGRDDKRSGEAARWQGAAGRGLRGW